jgi:hypothetical protein
VREYLTAPVRFAELIVDIYFIADLVLNFFTAFEDKNGTREDRPHKIALNYIKGWFIIDLASCVPIQYFICPGPPAAFKRPQRSPQ